MNRIRLIKIVISLMTGLAASCAVPENSSQYSPLRLTRWEVNIGGGFLPSAPVPWDFPPEKGGIDAADFDGYGIYRTSVLVPRSMAARQLALFIQSIDDADETFFNGVRIGSTGRFPYNVRTSEGFIPAWRTPRVYPLPQGIIRFDRPNSIEIKVYDQSGRGGFAGYYPPEIAEFEALTGRASMLSAYNDIPREAVMIVILFFILLLASRLMFRSRKADFTYALRHMAWGINPYYFFRAIAGRERRSAMLSQEVTFKYLCSLTAFVMFFIFLFFELTVKDLTVLPRLLPVRYHVPVLYSGFVALLLMLHGDVYRHAADNPSRTGTCIRVAFGTLSHPFFFTCYVLFICFQPERWRTNDFTVRGSVIILVIIFCMFARSFFSGLRIRSDERNDPYMKIYFRETVIRLFFLAGSVAAIGAFTLGPPFLFTHSSTIGAFFVSSFIALTIRMERKRFELYRSLEEKTKRIVKRALSSEEKIKRVKAFIDDKYGEDITRDDIAGAAGMSVDHLSRTFSLCTGKTIAEYINETRIRNAARMLLETDKTVIEIAFESGFNSLRTFNRAFARQVKVSPTQYRMGKYNIKAAP